MEPVSQISDSVSEGFGAGGCSPESWALLLPGQVPHPPCASLSLSAQWCDDTCSLFPSVL